MTQVDTQEEAVIRLIGALRDAAHHFENDEMPLTAHLMMMAEGTVRALADERDALRAELASEEEMSTELQKALEGMARKWASEKALGDALAYPFIYGGDCAAPVAAYRKARGL